MYYAKELVKQIQEQKQVVIYGARIVAKEVANCLMALPYNIKISAFMVTNLEGNPSEILDIPVINVEEGKRKYKDALILVAVLERYEKEIRTLLRTLQFDNVIYLTFESDLWSEIRGNYFRYLCIQQNKEYLTLEQELENIVDKNVSSIKESVHIYVAKCIADRKLKTDTSKYDWEIPIQVGTELTEQRIAKITDNTGTHISEKNKTYCELTALYWIWKNDNSIYTGLCHYRRHFELNIQLLDKLLLSDIDVVLTIPILNFPNVETMYANDHYQEDWEIMLQAIKILQPKYEKTAYIVSKSVFYYAYNMFIAKKDIFNNYCEWLFPILEYCEKRCKTKENAYQNRFIGFLAERLLTIYFMHNEQSLKIVHAKKHFITE